MPDKAYCRGCYKVVDYVEGRLEDSDRCTECGSEDLDFDTEATCECQFPNPSLWPNGRHMCIRCWGWYYK